MIPEASSFQVSVYLHPDGDIWIAECDSLPIATEALTVGALVQRVWDVAPEIAELNGHEGKVRLCFTGVTVA